MHIHILFGTESGNAELVAEDLREALAESQHVECSDLADFEIGQLRADSLYLIVCSTHGEGELPQSARPFFTALSSSGLDLTHVRYAMFGLGDSSYEKYSRGSEHIDEALARRGASRLGPYGRHDASGREEATDLVIAWVSAVVLDA